MLYKVYIGVLPEVAVDYAKRECGTGSQAYNGTSSSPQVHTLREPMHPKPQTLTQT